MSLELALAIPQRGTRMSLHVNWPLLCQNMAGKQDTQWAVVSGWKEGERGTRKPWKWSQLQGHMKKNYPWLPPFSNFPFYFFFLQIYFDWVVPHVLRHDLCVRQRHQD